MKKLLFMNDMLYGGGVEKVLQDIIVHLDKEKYDITIITPDKESEYHDLYASNVKFMRMYIRPLFKDEKIIHRVINKLNRLISIFLFYKKINNKYDVAIAIKEGNSMKYIANCKVPKKLAWIHTDYIVAYWTRSVFSRNEELQYMKMFNNVVCVSEATEEGIKSVIGDSGNLCVKYNPVNEIVVLEKSKEKTDIEKTKEKVLFVSVGRLTKQKGYDRLFEVIYRLNKDGYEFDLWIVGDGPEKEKLQEFINEYKIGNIKLLGNQMNPYKFMKQADCFICSSTWETFGIALQESIILNVPVLTTLCPGACEIINKDTQGIVVENNAEGIYVGMQSILNNPELLSEFVNKMKSEKTYLTAFERVQEIERLF